MCYADAMQKQTVPVRVSLLLAELVFEQALQRVCAQMCVKLHFEQLHIKHIKPAAILHVFSNIECRSPNFSSMGVLVAAVCNVISWHYCPGCSLWTSYAYVVPQSLQADC